MPIFQFAKTNNMLRLYTTLILLLLIIYSGRAQDMSCEADSALLATEFIVSPTPFVNDTLGEGIVEPACINMTYSKQFIVRAPSTFIFNSFVLNVDSFVVDSVTNLPLGMTYECSTPDCVILSDSIACITISGTPTDGNQPGDYELAIALQVHIGDFSIEANFPDPALAPGTYTLTLNPEGDTSCQVTTPTFDVAADETGMLIFPNPVSEILNVSWIGKQQGAGHIELRNIAGALIQRQEISYITGQNQYELPLRHLQNGMYLVGIKTNEGSSWKRIIKRE